MPPSAVVDTMGAIGGAAAAAAVAAALVTHTRTATAASPHRIVANVVQLSSVRKWASSVVVS